METRVIVTRRVARDQRGGHDIYCCDLQTSALCGAPAFPVDAQPRMGSSSEPGEGKWTARNGTGIPSEESAMKAEMRTPLSKRLHAYNVLQIESKSSCDVRVALRVIMKTMLGAIRKGVTAYMNCRSTLLSVSGYSSGQQESAGCKSKEKTSSLLTKRKLKSYG